MMPSSTDAVSIVFPFTPKICLTAGTSTHIPKNPYTTDGIPAIRLINGLMTLYAFGGQNFDKNIAVRSPIGTPITIAPAVT